MTRSTTGVTAQDEDSDVNFISRWSRLKHETKQNTENAAIEKITAEKADQTDELDEQQKSSAKILTDEDMPDLESMTADSDYTDFLSPGVSDGLRKLALRKLFHSEVFNICDGLDEYDGDYTQFEKLGDVVTSDMQHQIELEAKRKAKQLLDDDSDVNNNRNDFADENWVAEINPEVTEIQPDESQTLKAAQAAVENRALGTLLSVETEANNDLKDHLENNKHKTADNTELEAAVAKRNIKPASQNYD